MVIDAFDVLGKENAIIHKRVEANTIDYNSSISRLEGATVLVKKNGNYCFNVDLNNFNPRKNGANSQGFFKKLLSNKDPNTYDIYWVYDKLIEEQQICNITSEDKSFNNLTSPLYILVKYFIRIKNPEDVVDAISKNRCSFKDISKLVNIQNVTQQKMSRLSNRDGFIKMQEQINNMKESIEDDINDENKHFTVKIISITINQDLAEENYKNNYKKLEMKEKFMNGGNQ